MLGNPERGGRVAGCRCAADEDGKGGFHYFRTYADLAQLEQLHGVGNITCHTPYEVVANVMKTAELPGKNPQEEVFRAAEALMKQIAIATRKLRQLGVARTERPISDYVEWVVSEKLGLRLNSNPIEQGFDAVDTDGKRYQIKSRMIPKRSGNTGFDNIEPHDFDYLICTFVDPATYQIHSAYKVPRSVVLKHTVQYAKRKSFRWERVSRTDPEIAKVI